MSSILNWCSQNPKKAALLSTIGLLTTYNKTKDLFKTPKSLKGKIVLVTGGACGLGKLISMRCYDEGSIVLIWDINKQALKECAAIKTNANGGAIYASFVDVTNKSKVDAEAKTILSKYGNVDILIHNAGVVAGRPLFELSEQDIRRTFNVNVISQYWTLKAFLPTMIEKKSGHIVSIVSTAAFCAISHQTDYGASKAAARSLDESIKRELIDLGLDEGIVFTAIFPGLMNSGMFAGAVYKDFVGSTLFTGKKMLEPEYVCDETMKAIKYEKRDVLLPKMQRISILVSPFLPYKFQDDMLIYSNSMKEFIGGKNRLKKSKL